MWYIYILECSNQSLYTGITKNIEKRLKSHQSGKGGKFTRSFLPKAVVYQETCRSENQAKKREAAIKRLSRAQKLALVRAYSSTACCGS